MCRIYSILLYCLWSNKKQPVHPVSSHPPVLALSVLSPSPSSTCLLLEISTFASLSAAPFPCCWSRGAVLRLEHLYLRRHTMKHTLIFQERKKQSNKNKQEEKYLWKRHSDGLRQLKFEHNIYLVKLLWYLKGETARTDSVCAALVFLSAPFLIRCSGGAKQASRQSYFWLLAWL